MKNALGLVSIMLVAGCAAAPIPAPRSVSTERPSAVRPALATRGLETVMGKDIGTLKRLFGEPRLNVVEVVGRKLQFTGKACVLDTFLYPEGKNGAEIVTYVDARRSDGAAVDRAACVDALQRR